MGDRPIELFTGLEGAVRAVIVGAATRRTIQKSDIIIRAGQKANQLFLIRTGCLNLYVLTSEGRMILLQRLSAGDTFGLGAFLQEPNYYESTAQAVFKSEVLIWDQRLIRGLARDYPRFIENALQIVKRYVTFQTNRHMRLISETAQTRLGVTLAGLASHSGRVLPNGIELEITNEHLAALADIGFFTASRILKSWERNGTIQKGRGKILILNPGKLRAA